MSTPASPTVNKTVEVADGTVGVSSGTPPAPKRESVTGGSDTGDFVEVKSPVQPPAVPSDVTAEVVEASSERVQEVDDTTTRSANEEDQKASKAATVEDAKEDGDATQVRLEDIASSPGITYQAAKNALEVGNPPAPMQESQEKATSAKKAHLPKRNRQADARPSRSRGRDDNGPERVYAHDPTDGSLLEIPNLFDSNGRIASALVETVENGRKVLKPIWDGNFSIVEIPTLVPADQAIKGPAGSSRQGLDVQIKAALTFRTEGSEPSSSEHEQNGQPGSSNVSPRTVHFAPVHNDQRRARGGTGHTGRPPYPQTLPSAPVHGQQVRVAETPTVLGPYPAPPNGDGNPALGPGNGFNNSMGRPAVGRRGPVPGPRVPMMPPVTNDIQAPPMNMANPPPPPPPACIQDSNNNFGFPHGHPNLVESGFPHGRPHFNEPGFRSVDPLPSSPIPSFVAPGFAERPPMFNPGMYNGGQVDSRPPFFPPPSAMSKPTANEGPTCSDVQHAYTSLFRQQEASIKEATRGMNTMADRVTNTLVDMAQQLISQNRETQHALRETQKMLMEVFRNGMNPSRELAPGGSHNYTVQTLNQYNGHAPRSDAPTGGNDRGFDHYDHSRERGNSRPRRTGRTFHWPEHED